MPPRRRLAVVTGASRGIGKATAALLRKRGMTVVGLSRHAAGTHDLRADVADEDSVRRAFAEIARRHGRIDVLVNAAGIASRKPSLKLTAADWEDVLRPNLIGTYLCCKHVIPGMVRNRYGRIVNFSSIAGRTYSKTASLPYTCSKYAVIGLTRQLAAEFGARGVTVNAVCPSQTQTEMLIANVPASERRRLARAVPLGRLAEPQEVAAVAAFLAAEEASYINGAVVDVNGGLA